MTEERSSAQRWQEYRPSKPLWFWSCIGAAILTMIIGFTAGSWTTGGTAERMAQQAADTARAELVAKACVKNFTSSPNFTSQLAVLKEANAWKRSNILQEKGWVTLAGMDKPLAAAASICADELAKIQSPSASSPQSATDSNG